MVCKSFFFFYKKKCGQIDFFIDNRLGKCYNGWQGVEVWKERKKSGIWIKSRVIRFL